MGEVADGKQVRKNGETVAAFLEEVSATDLARWRAFLELASPADEMGAAIDAVYKAPLVGLSALPFIAPA